MNVVFFLSPAPPVFSFSPHVKESRTVLDSGFHSVDSGFQVLDSSICSWKLDSGFQSLVGFRIPKPRIPDSILIKSFRIPDCRSKYFPDSLTLGRPFPSLPSYKFGSQALYSRTCIKWNRFKRSPFIKRSGNFFFLIIPLNLTF